MVKQDDNSTHNRFLKNREATHTGLPGLRGPSHASQQNLGSAIDRHQNYPCLDDYMLIQEGVLDDYRVRQRSPGPYPGGPDYSHQTRKMMGGHSDGRGSLQDARFWQRRLANRSKDLLATSISPQRNDPRAIYQMMEPHDTIQDPSQVGHLAGGHPRSTHQHHAVSALDLSRYRGRLADR